MHPVILSDGAIINGNKLFGKELDKVLTICEKLMRRNLFPLDNGYPRHPALHTDHLHPLRSSDDSKGKTFRELVNEWMAEHPVEMAQYNDAKANWENETARLLKTIYGIAKRHHVHIKWGAYGSAVCMPDRFYIYKGGKIIAMIQC